MTYRTTTEPKPPVHTICSWLYEVNDLYLTNFPNRNWVEDAGKRVFCTSKFIRDLARKLWENKRDHGIAPYLAVHVKGPSVIQKGGMIYEGATATGWQTVNEDDKEVEIFCCDHKNIPCTDGKTRDFYLMIQVAEIASIHVCN